MKDQVTTIEQSQRLMELGVPADKASMVWFGENDDMLAPRGAANDLTMYNQGEYLKDTIHYPAYTVADLLGILPMFIDIKHTSYLSITPCYDGWNVEYESNNRLDLIAYNGHKLIDVLTSMIEWLVSNGYKLEV